MTQTKWPFGKFIPDEHIIRSELPSSPHLIILYHIFNYYVAIDASAKLLSSIREPAVSKIGKRKIHWLVIPDTISIPTLLKRLPKCHIAINHVNL